MCLFIGKMFRRVYSNLTDALEFSRWLVTLYMVTSGVFMLGYGVQFICGEKQCQTAGLVLTSVAGFSTAITGGLFMVVMSVAKIVELRMQRENSSYEAQPGAGAGC